MSLFLRIFISFWLTALLLAASFFVLGRFYGSEAIERSEELLAAQAEVVAALWLEGDRRAPMRWLHQQDRLDRPLLLNAAGESPLLPLRRRSAAWAHGPIHAGVQHIPHGRVVVAVALPAVEPTLYLVRVFDLGQLHRLSPWIGLFSLMVIIGGMSALLAAVLSRRLRQLRLAAQVIAAGDLSARVVIRGRDEVSALADDFNLMAERVSEMVASQRRLVSDVSHELRSPLARLRVALALAERAADPSISLQRIEKEADELEQLISGLLSLARIESGESIRERQPVALCPLLNTIVADANYEGVSGRRSVVLTACDESIIEGDPVLLHSAIENVVRNGLRYTPEDGQVTVRLERVDAMAVITITDAGPGVPATELGRLFEPFARVQAARDRQSGGYGLGLAITGRAIEAHRGVVAAKNRSEGGLQVTLSLPLA